MGIHVYASALDARARSGVTNEPMSQVSGQDLYAIEVQCQHCYSYYATFTYAWKLRLYRFIFII